VDVSSNWKALEEKASAVRWVTALRDKLQPFSQGLYVNGLSETSEELVRAAYGVWSKNSSRPESPEKSRSSF
jgi:hypothetical protein